MNAITAINPLASEGETNTGRLLQQTLGKEAFLRLLVAQLQHQDPLDPVDNQQFVAQMAEFSTLEQMQNLNEGVQAQLFIESLSQSSALLGKRVEFMDPDTGALLSGKVQQVRMSGQEPRLLVGTGDAEQEILLPQIRTVLEGE